ncbi:unnamed protein product [Moneuplotes crassus]|uniref:Uncharacterized protein n=1 Tax=Euplotes crassus TaxID=5936 RepID=A0AAD1U8Z0_EUPCR|nr:unnamed protein product [Moneuplotes crassus]
MLRKRKHEGSVLSWLKLLEGIQVIDKYFKNKNIENTATPIKHLRNQKAKEKEEKERSELLQASKETPKIAGSQAKDSEMNVSNKILKTFNDYTDDDFSEKGITTTAKRRNSWNSSKMSPFTEGKQEFVSRKHQEKKYTRKEPVRTFNLSGTENVYSSYKNKPLLLQNTGTTSVGILSNKRQSKPGEFVDLGTHAENHTKKMVHPSPQVKLDQRRIPRKEPSKASKSSSKKSGKKRRVPKKYTKPNMTKEKVSNKSLVNNDTGQKDLLSNTNDSKRPSTNSELKPKNNSVNKISARFTIKHDRILAKQGVIPEDQNEDYYTNEDGSESSDETVSSVEENKYANFSLTSSKDLPPPPNPMKKSVSAAPGKQSIAGTVEMPFMSPPLRASKDGKEGVMNTQIDLLSPLPDIHKGRKQSSKSFGKSQGNNSNSLRANSQNDFQTDLSLLKNKSVAEKSKQVNSRLKMMI